MNRFQAIELLIVVIVFSEMYTPHIVRGILDNSWIIEEEMRKQMGR